MAGGGLQRGHRGVSPDRLGQGALAQKSGIVRWRGWLWLSFSRSIVSVTKAAFLTGTPKAAAGPLKGKIGSP